MNEKKSAFDTVSDKRAREFWEQEPGRALGGEKLASVEGDKSEDRSQPVVVLAAEEPERFLELVGYLPHAIQDILIQYYLLGRTQTQIGKLLGLSQTAVWQAVRLGVRSICAVIGGGVTEEQRKAREEMLGYRTRKESRELLKVEAPENLGEFRITTDDVNLMEFFAPSTTDGSVSKC